MSDEHLNTEGGGDTVDTAATEAAAATAALEAGEKSTDPPVVDSGTIDDAGKTVLEQAADGSGDDKTVVAPADWPENWRDLMAGGDEKELKRLGRFKSPINVFKSFRSQEQKMSSGEITPALPDKATDEQVAEFREANGIPDAPEGYELGIDIEEEDKPAVDAYLAKMHAENAPPHLVKKALATYYELQAEGIAALAENDAKMHRETEDALRAELGGDYRGTMQQAFGILDMGPDGFKENFLGARLADGSVLANNVEAINWLIGRAKELNPMGSIAPGGVENQVQTIKQRRAEISEYRKNEPAKYRKDSAVREEERRLIDAELRLSGKSVA